MRANEITNETAKTNKVTAVVKVMSIYCRKNAVSGALIPGMRILLTMAESAEFQEEDSRKSEDPSQKKKKGWILNTS
jgi:hypothetical protein